MSYTRKKKKCHSSNLTRAFRQGLKQTFSVSKCRHDCMLSQCRHKAKRNSVIIFEREEKGTQNLLEMIHSHLLILKALAN